MSTARTRPDFELRNDELSKLFDRLPPRAPEAEAALLGCLIIASDSNIHIIGDVIPILDKHGTDFEKPAHQTLYPLLRDLYDKNQSMDAVQLIQELRNRNVLEEVGGEDYVIQLAESVPIPEHAPYYAKLVRDAAKRRKLIQAAGRILKRAYESGEEADELIDAAEHEIYKIGEERQTNEPEELIKLVTEVYEQLDSRTDSGETLTGISTGFHDLDDMLSGLQKGEMIIVAARPSMGKTAFALNMAENIAMNFQQPVAIFSLEMGKQQLAQRLLSSRSGVDAQKMRRNRLNADEFRRLQEVVDEAYDAPMYIDDTPGLSVLELRAKARRLAQQRSIKAIFVDYMQLMSSPGAESRQQEVSQISRGIKALARELNVPVITLSQLNRNPEGRADNRPLLSDLRESGSIEQDADVVMMLHREEYYHKDPQWADENPEKVGLAELIIAKQRNGPTGIVPLHFNGATTRFDNRAHNL